MTGKHRVVVVGGGFGGLNVTRALADADAEVTVLDRTNLTTCSSRCSIRWRPASSAGAHRAGTAQHRQEAGEHEGAAGRRPGPRPGRTRSGRKAPDGRTLELPYDTLVVAAGATLYFGKDQWAEYAPGMKTVEDARYLRDGILSKFEMAELATDPQERAEWLTFVVIGAGPTGCRPRRPDRGLAHTVLPKDYRTVDTREAGSSCWRSGAVLLLAPKLQAYTKKRLEQMGVEIRLNTLAVDMDHESITVKGPDGLETIRTRTRIWAAVPASPWRRCSPRRRGRNRPCRPGLGQPGLHAAGHRCSPSGTWCR